MPKNIKRRLRKLTNKITKKGGWFVLLILSLAFFIRIYRINELLGFWYDQGRDALVIWDFVYNGKFFLIGPTTGIEGIFRGPWYYWLITPFYFLGKGSPVYPSIFLSFTTVVAVYILFSLAKEMGGKWAGYTAILIGSFSYSIVMSSRWLSNPTPMFLISMIFIWSIFRFFERKKWSLVLASFMVGLAMQFGSAAEVFYIPAFLLIMFINRRKLPGIKYIALSATAFMITFIPQIIFDLRHDGILMKAVRNFLFNKGSFQISFAEVLYERLILYTQTFTDPLVNIGLSYIWIIIPFIVAGAFFLKKSFWKNGKVISLLIIFIAPLLGLLFFQGNKGNIYSYYFTGYIFVYVLIISLLLGGLSVNVRGKLVLTCLILVFLFINFPQLKTYLSINPVNSKDIVLKNQLDALDWIYEDTQGRAFNVDIYVPPVITYSYDYLFRWKGTNKYNYQPSVEPKKLLYTIYEYDFYLPKRHEDWLIRQEGIGIIIKEERFGNLVVQKRERL